ncbi:MAG: hypothetical protein M3Z75_31745 [Actinomycetota bacterium]|nr:hypothetical protein [Actinomycetota bacterium]
MPDPGPDLDQGPATRCPSGPRHTGLTAAPDSQRSRIVQLAGRELDLYGNQLARCLQALGTAAPIRADVQRELAEVHAEQAARASASEPGRVPDVSGLAPGQLERTRRELHASLALARPGSPTRRPILAHLGAIDAELAQRNPASPDSD